MGTRVKIVKLLEQETKSCKGNMNGLWRSLVAHLTGGQGVAGSNPVNPTSLHKRVSRLLETRFSFSSTDSSSYLDLHLLCAATVTFAV